MIAELLVPDPEHIANHPPYVPQCAAESGAGQQCSRIAGHTQHWHQCWDRRTGRTLKTWETP